MTESEWLSSEEPTMMLAWLTEPDDSPPASRFGLASARRLRLFACACIRQVWHLLTDPRSRQAVEGAERFADGEATLGDLDRAWNTSLDAPRSPGAVAAGLVAIEGYVSDRMPTILACLAGAGAAGGAALLRDVVGNPWRPAPSEPCTECSGGYVPTDRDDNVCPCCRGAGRRFPPAWLTPVALGIARRAYGERPAAACPRCDGGRKLAGVDRAAFEKSPLSPEDLCCLCHGAGRVGDGTLDHATLAVLADALEEAGAEDADLLGHLRGPGPHVRGCFALDALLGKG